MQEGLSACIGDKGTIQTYLIMRADNQQDHEAFMVKR